MPIVKLYCEGVVGSPDVRSIRRQYFLYAFSGKDLLWALHKLLMAAKVGGGAPLFIESLLKGIEHKSKTEDIATWLQEWQSGNN